MTANRYDDLLTAIEAHRVDHEWPDWHLVDSLIAELKLWHERALALADARDGVGDKVVNLRRKLADAVYACEDNWGKWKRAEAALAREQAAHTQVPPGPDSTFRAWDFGRKLS